MMSEVLCYLLKVNGVFILLYLVYAVGFSRLTFHQLNRAFLMTMPPLSLVIPTLNIGIVSPIPVSKTELPQIFDAFGRIGNAVQTNGANSFEWNIGNILFLIYGSVVVFCLIKLILNVFRVIQVKRRSTTCADGKYCIIIADVPAVFSCLNWIFIPQNNDSTISKPIIEHEKLHGRAYHTLDLIAAELFIALFWFNPFVYLFRRSLKSVHEFQVDSLFLKSSYKTSDYLQLMLLNCSARATVFCNHFIGSTIKERIIMMTKNKSSPWKAGRYLLLLPFIALITMSFSVHNNHGNEIPDISPIKTEDYSNISSGYGMRIHPFSKEKSFHNGIDFAAKTGTPVAATAGGVVTRVVFLENSYGKLVEIDHGNGFTTRYAQMSDYAVKENDTVKKNDIIGYVGQSGLANGPHLHYEVLKDGKNVNPADYIHE